MAVCRLLFKNAACRQRMFLDLDLHRRTGWTYCLEDLGRNVERKVLTFTCEDFIYEHGFAHGSVFFFFFV